MILLVDFFLISDFVAFHLCYLTPQVLLKLVFDNVVYKSWFGIILTNNIEGIYVINRAFRGDFSDGW